MRTNEEKGRRKVSEGKEREVGWRLTVHLPTCGSDGAQLGCGDLRDNTFETFELLPRTAGDGRRTPPRDG